MSAGVLPVATYHGRDQIHNWDDQDFDLVRPKVVSCDTAAAAQEQLKGCLGHAAKL